MIDIEKVLQLRREGFSFRQIARQMNVSHVAVIKRLRKDGVSSGNSARSGNSNEFLKKTSHARLPEGITVQKKTPPYFIKEGTDEIFGYTRFLAERADMKPFWGTVEEFKKEKAKEKEMPKGERD